MVMGAVFYSHLCSRSVFITCCATWLVWNTFEEVVQLFHKLMKTDKHTGKIFKI